MFVAVLNAGVDGHRFRKMDFVLQWRLSGKILYSNVVIKL